MALNTKASASTRKAPPAPAKPAASGKGAKAAPQASKAPAAATGAPATVTLKHLAAALAETHDMTKSQAEGLATNFVGLLVDQLKGGNRLRIAGLGILEVKNRPARTGRNPATGEVIEIAASKKIAFRPSKELKEAV